MLRVENNDEQEDTFQFSPSAASKAQDHTLKPFLFAPLNGDETSPAKSSAAGPDIPRFIGELDEAERGALRLISHGSAGTDTVKTLPLKAALEELAEKSGTMPELLIDSVNEKFQDTFNDLLIDISEGGASIQEEYRDEVCACFEEGI
jgi:hypothetical protein